MISHLPDSLYTRRAIEISHRKWAITSVENQDALLARTQTDTDLANFPYGLMLWPSAIGLCEHLAENAALVQNKRVLEIGAGVGLVGLVAQTLQPASVVQTDYHENALGIARENARQNGLADVISIKQGDWRNWPDDLTDFDLVIGSDVLYERSLHDDLARLFSRLLSPRGQIVLSDPLRPQSLTFVDRIEKSGQWGVQMDGRRVAWQPNTGESQWKDIAIFTLTRLA